MMLLEVRDLATNDLLTSYDVTDAVDQPGVVRAVAAGIPDTACIITVERDEPMGDLTVAPDPIAAPVIEDPIPAPVVQDLTATPVDPTATPVDPAP